MSELKFTKNELRNQQLKLAQLDKYLPTLQLKKAMLQLQANEVRLELVQLDADLAQKKGAVEESSSLFFENTGLDPYAMAKVKEVQKRYENIAGVDIPYYEGVVFSKLEYSLFETPAWVDAVVGLVRVMVEAGLRVHVALEKKAAIEKELREVSIRVNLFEKVLIPRAVLNIKKIKVFLGDQQLAAVARAKVAKNKVESRKRERVQ